MADDTSTRGAARRPPARSAHPSTNGAEIGYAVVGTMVSGMAVWGGIGWLLDNWLGITLFFPVGVLVGMALAIFMVVKRYGAPDPVPGSGARTTSGTRRNRPVPGNQTQKGQR
ncbi:hypothetical protein GB931_18825 [Modestobacter sp. I12A-02628]|uniref:AtpZ/AtpI family protein n=1 Tax=Goekera deserti TaxID=2497753 RepID=A0A7K3W7J0_9ACTN|nr:AtpZ/AtpI family protein [Goekera deserti]MPQ99932.1 hypothetical protein [Goekera deserti]NDI50091.1 hypothetical protein [Goekera deserti]NEL52432.1 hypothetical protein [Goekera deserti]